MQTWPGFFIFWKILTNHYGMVAQVFTIKSDHGMSEADNDRIVEWARSILPERNRLKKTFYTAKFIMEPLSLGYQKTDMCPNFCILYYLENIELTECRTCEHSRYKPKTSKERTFVAHKKNLDTSHSHLYCRGYSCHQRLLSTWHDTNHMMWWMEWWCTLLMVKHRNTLIVCILSFQWNQWMCILGYVHTNSIHSSHLMLLILVGQLYSRFRTCYWGCVWGRSLCFYLWSYLILIAAKI
jgi:hypothetical protein